jgi:V/A-type H+/Na+-transporting ATPase subunit E
VNGLEAILARITSDAEASVQDISGQANERCAEILKQADQDAAAIIGNAESQADEQAAALLRRARSLATLETRKQLLSARQSLIDEAIERAAASLASLPAAEKSALFRRLLLANARGGETVVFASRDQALAEEVLAAVNAENSWHLKRDPVPGDFKGGLVLRQDLIETNLTIDLLVRSLRPELVSLAAKALFAS